MKTKDCIILDDNEITSYLISTFLKDVGDFNPRVFSYTQQLLEELKFVDPDYIFINVMMKGQSVRELAANKKMPIHKFIFISDLHKSEEKRKCFLDSHRPYITTPLSTEVIREGLFLA